jgi:hypothetical protein
MTKTLEAVAGGAQAKLQAEQAVIDARFKKIFNLTGLRGIERGQSDERFPISSLEFDRQVHDRSILPADREFLLTECKKRGLISG